LVVESWFLRAPFWGVIFFHGFEIYFLVWKSKAVFPNDWSSGSLVLVA